MCQLTSDTLCDNQESLIFGAIYVPFSQKELEAEEAFMECVRKIHAWSQIRNPPMNALDFLEDRFQDFYAQDEHQVSLVPANLIAYLMAEKERHEHRVLACHLCETFNDWKGESCAVPFSTNSLLPPSLWGDAEIYCAQIRP